MITGHSTVYDVAGNPLAYSPTVNPYKFSAKEFETRHGLNFSHHGARLMLNDLTRFATPDPLAELTPGVSPYTYCLSDPINLIDTEGLKPRLLIETSDLKNGSLGHVFLSIGEGNNLIVYTYGRYGDVSGSSRLPRAYSPTGEGVLKILKGREARSYIQEATSNKSTCIVEYQNVDENKIDEYFQNLFKDGTKSKADRIKNNKNARVINQYNLLYRNCLTTSTVALMRAGAPYVDVLLRSRTPDQAQFLMMTMAQVLDYLQYLVSQNREIIILTPEEVHSEVTK